LISKLFCDVVFHVKTRTERVQTHMYAIVNIHIQRAS